MVCIGTCTLVRIRWSKHRSYSFFFGIRICYTLHVCKYKDACGWLINPVGKTSNVIWSMCCDLACYWCRVGPTAPEIIHDPRPPHPPVGLHLHAAEV